MLKGFFSYAPEDRREATALKDGLSQHLYIWRTEAFFWETDRIGIGIDWESDVLKNLNDSDFSIIAISPKLLSNPYIMGELLKKIEDRKKVKKGYAVFPILLKPSPLNIVDGFNKIRYYFLDGTLHELPKKEVSFSLVLKEGSPLIDEYFNDLVPRLLETLKDSLIKDKDFLEESVKLNHPHRELIDVLNNQKEPLINQIRVVISSLFPEIENDFTLEMEISWLIEIIIARIVAQDQSAYKKYLQEERFLPYKVFPTMASLVMTQLSVSIPHREILVKIVEEFGGKLETLANVSD